MNYGNIDNIINELCALKEQKNTLEYGLSLDGLIKQMDTLKTLKRGQIILIDNRYDERLDACVETYVGKLGDEFIPLTGAIVYDGRIPHIKIQFIPETLNRFYYIDRGYAITLKAVPEGIGYIYPHSEILSEKGGVTKKLESEHYEPFDSTVEKFIESLEKK